MQTVGYTVSSNGNYAQLFAIPYAATPSSSNTLSSGACNHVARGSKHCLPSRDTETVSRLQIDGILMNKVYLWKLKPVSEAAEHAPGSMLTCLGL